jgi:hypothetical protein
MTRKQKIGYWLAHALLILGMIVLFFSIPFIIWSL